MVTTNELYHYGIKGMKWGVRRYQNKDGSLTPAGKKRASRQERKQAKKEVKKFAKDMARSGQTGQLVTMATASKFSSKDYDKLANAMDSGRLVVSAKVKTNWKDRSIDIYVGGQRTPTIRAQMLDGSRYAADFINKADQIRYNEFADYYNKRHS